MRINDEIEIVEYEAFEEKVNINLFNNLVSFIMETTNIENLIILNRLKREHIWFKMIPNNDIQAEYNFRYLGELLERYGERENVTIKEIRAIALGIAYAKDLISNDMIIGKQLIDFINKIYEMSNDDIYLKGALYVYDNDKYASLFEELVNQKFETTEDIVFVLSLFNDLQIGFDRLKEPLIELLGKSKTISAMNNVGMYNWIIKRLYRVVKNCRKKGIGLIKALISIPTSFIKQDSKFFCILLENKYTKDEIAFLNYVLIHYQSVPNCVRINSSIVEEKIAISCCETILNSETVYSEYIYNLIYSLINKYTLFNVKCYGFRGIREALKYKTNIKIPEVFIKFYTMLEPNIHSFDILNAKWDIVQRKFDEEEYEKLFDNYLQYYEFTKEEIESRIKKYEELTASSYIESFFNYNYKYIRNSIFTVLVEKDVINLPNFFNQYINKKEKYNLEYLSNYVSGINTRKAFEFLKYFLNQKDYTIKDTKKFGINMNNLYHKSYSYYSSTWLNIKRDFLSNDEQKELFMWLEEYNFYLKPESYIDFTITVLQEDIVSTIFSKDELKELYYIISDIDDSVKKNKILREKYLSTEELEKLVKKEEEEEENRKLIEQQKIENELLNEIYSIENITLKDIYKFCSEHLWRTSEGKICGKIVKQFLNENLKNQNITADEIINFNKVCNMLIDEQIINIEEFKCYVIKFIRNGDLILCKEY